METAAPSDDVKERRAETTPSQSAEIRDRRCRGDRDAVRRGGAMASRERAAVPRQRGDKTRTPSAAPPDAVPGRLCEAQWLSVLAAEERDDAVGDVVAELLGAVAERCFRAELSRQCAPFAVDWARAELLQAVAWRFLVRDEGDAAPEAAGAWREDEEPLPCADDAWAEGAVPVLPACPTPAHGEVSGTGTDAVPSEAEGGSVSAPPPSTVGSGRGARCSPALRRSIGRLPYASPAAGPAQPRHSTAPAPACHQTPEVTGVGGGQ
ncbi:uncharacterized protein C2orf81 homolog isoform X1 [Gallus gallus]|uniref:uncharacterized protein C2orf81 homolog isoform X1 n=1 Tax=Gallus gallus TaxID=9031 RepID=UPI001AE174BB|nr:uncharacterized protein C2orf81 homolog isoform X1 [Gallus gallus]